MAEIKSNEDLQEWMIDNLQRIDAQYREAVCTGALILMYQIDGKIDRDAGATVASNISEIVNQDFDSFSDDCMKTVCHIRGVSYELFEEYKKKQQVARG